MFDLAPAPAPTPALPLQQSPIFASALRRLGVPCLRHHLPGAEAQVILRTLPILGRTALISRGPIWSLRPKARALSALRQALDARHLIVNADTTLEGATLEDAGFLRIAAPRRIAELSLDGTPEDWLSRMSGKWRNRLRHGSKQGLRVRIGPLPSDPNYWLFRMESEQQRRLKYKALPHSVLLEMIAAHPGSVMLLTAHQDQKPVAAMVFVSHGAIATYQIGWSDPAGRAASAHNHLLWEAMQHLAATGHQKIDLGAADGAQSPGLTRFKLGSGAVARDLGGTWLDSAWTAPIQHLRRAAWA